MAEEGMERERMAGFGTYSAVCWQEAAAAEANIRRR